MRVVQCIFVFYLTLGHVRCNGNASLTPIYIGGLFELSNNFWRKYAGFFPAVVEYAFEGIHNNSEILDGYELKLLYKDTQGVPGLAAKMLDELVEDEFPKVAVIGPGFSTSLTVTGQMAPFYNVLEMSFVASTSNTVDRELFPTLFRVNAIQDDLIPVRIQIMKYFGWTKVATILFQDDLFVTQMNNFHASLKENNMTLLTSVLLSKDSDNNVAIAEQVQRLKQYDARIIMAGFRSDVAPFVYCEAYKLGMYGERYVWIHDGPHIPANWISIIDETKIPCSTSDLYAATSGHFRLEYVRFSSQDTPTISGLTVSEFQQVMDDKVAQTSFKKTRNVGWLYDSVWAIALCLNNSLALLNETGLRDYNYSAEYVQAFKKGISHVNFQGVSGPVAFDETGGRLGVTSIQQINGGDIPTKVGLYDHVDSKLDWLVPVHTLWPGGEAPKDQFEYRKMLAPASTAALVVILILNTAGVILSVGFLGFNVKFRNNRNIKMSSPSVNNVIVGGSFMMYLAVYLAMVDYSNVNADAMVDSICMVRGWVMSIGFTVLFGALFTKTWRIHAIFRQQQLKRKVIRDLHLFGILGMLLAVDCVILMPWTALQGVVKDEARENHRHLQDYNIIVIRIYRYCSHANQGYWFAALYVYKGLLLAFGTFLAWETRGIKVAALNDSKEIGFCVYNVVIVCMFGVPLAHVLPIEQTTLSFVLVSSFIIFCTTLSLCIIFVPKIRIRHQIESKTFVSGLGTDQAIPTSQLSKKGNGEGGNSSQAATDTNIDLSLTRLQEENARLRKKTDEEEQAVMKLKLLILAETGNLQFEKVGQEYQIYRTPVLESCGDTSVA